MTQDAAQPKLRLSEAKNRLNDEDNQGLSELVELAETLDDAFGLPDPVISECLEYRFHIPSAKNLKFDLLVTKNGSGEYVARTRPVAGDTDLVLYDKYVGDDPELVVSQIIMRLSAKCSKIQAAAGAIQKHLDEMVT